MRISDIVRLRPPAEGINFVRLQELRRALDREATEWSLLTGVQASELIESYQTPLDPSRDPLHRFLANVASQAGRGTGLLVRGPRRSGKTYLLALADLLLEYPRLRPLMAGRHPHYEAVLQALGRVDPLLVVPIPLQEHRAHEEHLEDIFFDRTEQELARRGIHAALSEQAYALDLIERHILPRYAAELDAQAARLPGSQRSWRELREKDPSAAIAAARAFAQEIGYPLDFRQSRVERLARLLDILHEQRFRGIVWLVDDLGQFLAATGQKAVRNDAAFLEFLGQRSKIAPLHLLATISSLPASTAGLEPFMLAEILDNYELFELSSADLRQIARQRALRIPDDEQFAAALAHTYELYRKAFGALTFSEEELRRAYPLHPLALSCLEAIYLRFFNEADALIDFFQRLEQSEPALLDRPPYQLLSLPELLGPLSGRLSAHPQAAAYLLDILDYYVQHGASLYPAQPHLPLTLAQALVVLRLGNLSVPLPALAEALGLQADGHPRVTASVAREVLEQMRLRGRFVDIRRATMPEADAYFVDTDVNLTESARRHLLALKASLADDDPRLVESVLAAASGPGLPLADFAGPRLLEVSWLHSLRTIRVEFGSLLRLHSDRLTADMTELADSTAPEDVRLYIAEPLRVREQYQAWRDTAAFLPQNRWAAGLIAWLPAELTPEQLDRLKEFTACRLLLQSPAGPLEDRLRERLLEEASRLQSEVRVLLEEAYAGGEIVSGQGLVVREANLPAVRGDWAATLASIAYPALSRVYPRYRDIAPQRPVSAELAQQIISQLLSTEALRWPDDGPAGQWAEQILAPLQLARREEGGWRLTAETSEIAAEIMERVRRRDQTPEQRPGRALAYSSLLQHLAKSPFGLPAPLAEIAIAALLRTGYLLALSESRQPLSREALRPPLERTVAYIARAPLLSVSEWQELTRVARLLLERMIPRMDHASQMEIWEELVQACAEQTRELTRLRRLLEALQERLEQTPAQWSQTSQALEALQQVFDALDPQLLPAEGLTRLLEYVRPLLQGTPSGLSQLLRTQHVLQQFFAQTAEDVVKIYDYLRSPELAAVTDSEFQNRREQLLAMMASGEKLLQEETAFRRLVQIVFAIYKRRYLAWHSRCYRPALFDKYRLLRATPELRVLAHLQRLQLKPDYEGPHAIELIEAQEARRCTFPGLQEALDETPTCPQCHLRLDEEPEFVAPEEIKAVAEQEIAAYVRELRRPAFQNALRAYAEALPQRGDLAVRLEQLLRLSENPPARTLLAIFTDELIVHLNRVLSGQRIRPRHFGQLRALLAGRTLSPQEAEQLFRQWLAGGGEGEHLDNGDVLHIEP